MGDSGPEEGVKGVVEDVKGKAKEVAGTVTGHDDLREEGRGPAGQGRRPARRRQEGSRGRGRPRAQRRRGAPEGRGVELLVRIPGRWDARPSRRPYRAGISALT